MFLICAVCFLSVTGASRGYAFVEFETEREMQRAYKVLQYLSNVKSDSLKMKYLQTHA